MLLTAWKQYSVGRADRGRCLCLFNSTHVGQCRTVNRSVVMWMQVPWDYYAFRNGSRTRVLADIPPFGLALDGAWIAHYYIKVSQHARSAHVFLQCMIVMCFCLCAVL